jgi:hypothetical protein
MTTEEATPEPCSPRWEFTPASGAQSMLYWREAHAREAVETQGGTYRYTGSACELCDDAMNPTCDE